MDVLLHSAKTWQLDRYIDQLEVPTGLKANRGMIARRALALFLGTHATDPSGRTL